MAGEYYRWLARNEKPQEKQELTPEQKRRNWWDYHKWYVIVGIVCAILMLDFVGDVVNNARNRPDYSIAYVGCTALPDDAALALEHALAELGEDLNGNGHVQVELTQYLLSEDMAYASSMQLTANIEMAQSMIWLLEDPEDFNANYPILCHADGTLPGGQSDAPLYYSWSDCPVLTALELDGSLAHLSVARRGLWKGEESDLIDGAIRLWETMTAGAGA